jgi:radical SAM superfamily enzyme YgiQ (UPF0313 family)
MRLLLINPRFPESFWSFRWAIDEILVGTRALNPPLGLATLAALCPPDWDVSIVDENVESIPLEPQADLIGVCGMGVQFERQKALLDYYRSEGYFVVAGGSYASLCPEKYTTLADAVVAGEAEHVWPQFCADFERGVPQPVYQDTGAVELTDSPTPRFDLLKLDRYNNATLQFSRGCPYRCDFCDIIVMFGRKPRCKSLEQIERELDALRRLGARNVFFVDDNLIGNRPLAKRLLRFLGDYQRRHGYRFSFGTEASLNLAQDAELLGLFRDAGFGWVFIGIETPDAQSLQETHKTQNMKMDILAALRTIYAHGIDVLGGFIVGFDNDTVETFDRQYEFIMASGIQAAMVGLLTALPRTPLYERLENEGRLLQEEDSTDNTRLGTNIVPKRMSPAAMVDGYLALYRRLLTDSSIAERIRNKLCHMGRPVYQSTYPALDSIGIVFRLLAKGILPGGPTRVAHFLRTLPLRAPSRLPLVIAEWITGLSMRRYVERRFGAEADASTLERCVAAVRGAIVRELASGKVTLSLAHAWRPNLAMTLSGLLDRRFFTRAGPELERLLARTHASVTLRVEAFQAQQRHHFERLLRRLARYGDRVSIVIDARLRALLPVDSSIFNLVLHASADQV